MPPLAFSSQHEHIALMRIWLPALFLLAAACTPQAPADNAAARPEPGVTSSGMQTAAANCLNRSSDKIGGPFHLTAQDGGPTTEANFKGRKTLVYFGFTHCPDVCPTTLFTIGKAISLLPPGKPVPRTVLISVDPARDTPEALAQYIRSNGFPEDITGLTGTIDELKQVSDEFAAPFSRDEDADSASGYLVSHSSILYLMDENWQLKTFFTEGQSAQEIATCLAEIG
jgi:protein SCO1/2